MGPDLTAAHAQIWTIASCASLRYMPNSKEGCTELRANQLRCCLTSCQIDRPIQWNVMEHNGKSIQNSGWFGMQTSWSFWKVLKTIAESFQKLSGQSPAVYIEHTYPDRTGTQNKSNSPSLSLCNRFYLWIKIHDSSLKQ